MAGRQQQASASTEMPSTATHTEQKAKQTNKRTKTYTTRVHNTGIITKYDLKYSEAFTSKMKSRTA
jgi:hypothetical protein